MTVRCGFFQFRCFGQAMRSTIGKGFKRTAPDSNNVSPLQAASTALASTVGTGNIVGTAQAITMGGPGAVFWLWVTALFGMIIKYAEIFLALKFRRKDKNGNYHGGPMYYIEAMGKSFCPLAAAYAMFALLSAIGMGNLSQVNSGVSAISLAINKLAPMNPDQEILFKLALGAFLAILVYIILSGGAKRVGRAAELLVPLMSLGFLMISLIFLICRAHELPSAISKIILSAFDSKAFGGAALGISVREAIHWGIRRSAFSNEAGLGSSAMAHAAAETKNYMEHSLWGIFEVFADTILICTAAALVILCSGVDIPWNTIPGPELFQNALSTVFGHKLSSLFMAGSMLVFAFATVLGWSLYGAQCAAYLFGNSSLPAYRIIYCLCTGLGSIMSTTFVWTIADFSNALMAIPNFIALFYFSGVIKRETANFFQTKTKKLDG